MMNSNEKNSNDCIGAEGPSSSSIQSQSLSTTTVTQTQTITKEEETSQQHTLRLRLTKNPKKLQRRVSWTTDTVDNEFLNRKKSKCCCIYQKPHEFGESSSEDENEDKDCQHCKGHRKTDYNSLKEKEETTIQNTDNSTTTQQEIAK